jgi:hypothetical protein
MTFNAGMDDVEPHAGQGGLRMRRIRVCLMPYNSVSFSLREGKFCYCPR